VVSAAGRLLEMAVWVVAKPVSIGAHVSSSGGIFTAVERGAEIEAESLQIFASAPQMWRATKHKPEAIERFRELRAEAGLSEVWIHNIYLANLATDDAEMLEKSINSIVNAMTVADAIGAEGVILHTGSHKGRGLDAVSEQVCDSLEAVLDQSPGEALLALENAAGHGGTIGTTFAELGGLLGRVGSDRLAVCVDTCHAFAAGYDISTADGLDAAMAEFDGEIGLSRLAVVHANDSKSPLGGGRDRHENIGDGHIGLDGFRVMLAHDAFAGRAFLLEVPGYPDGEDKAKGPDLRNVRALRELRDEAAGSVKPRSKRSKRAARG
jgi:deoxyribonuclease-4